MITLKLLWRWRRAPAPCKILILTALIGDNGPVMGRVMLDGHAARLGAAVVDLDAMLVSFEQGGAVVQLEMSVTCSAEAAQRARVIASVGPAHPNLVRASTS